MLVENFKDEASQYSGFEIWDIENIEAFFSGNGVISEMFQIEYQMKVSEFKEKREDISQTDMEIMKNLLGLVGDKHFFVFTYHDDHHSELVHMQDTKIMNFGIDIGSINKDHVYVVIMDKKPQFDSLPN